MAKRKSPDKFRVGQTVAFVFNQRTGFRRYNGRLTVVLSPRVYGDWPCADPVEAPERGEGVESGWRYRARNPEPGKAPMMVDESHLRPIYDSEKLSTWDNFAKATGIDLAATSLVAKPVSRSRGKPLAHREVVFGAGMESAS